MRPKSPSLRTIIVKLGLACLMLTPWRVAASPTIPTDKYEWLKGQFDPKAVTWAAAETQDTVSKITATPVFAEVEQEIAAAQKASAPIPRYFLLGKRIVRYVRDADHPAGLLEMAERGSGGIASGPWKTVLDLATFSKVEGKSYEFVFLDLAQQCLAPAYDRCLLPLSPGGASNVEYREFSFSSGNFVESGFRTPPNRAFFEWLDADTLLIQHSLFGSPALRSGFPAVTRLWMRGTPLADAKAVFTAAQTDSFVGTAVAGEGSMRRGILSVARDYGTFELKAVDRDGHVNDLGLPTKLKRLGAPVVLGNKLVFQLGESATIEGKFYASEALISYDIAAPANARVGLVYQPKAGSYVNTPFGGIAATGEGIGIVQDTHLRKTLLFATPGSKGWSITRSVTAPVGASMSIVDADATGRGLLIREEGFLTPGRVRFVVPVAAPVTISVDKPIIDANQFVSEIREARSRDGTSIDYYIVRPKTPKPGPVPTIIEGYGGFGANVEPKYFSSGLGRSLPSWLNRGGAYVVTAIRGGGERGDAWHKAAMGINRQRSYDDFIAVAESLIRSGFTKPRKIGAYGRSFGGLLTAVMTTQRPDLFDAAYIGVPITDIFDLGKGDSGIGGGQKAELGDWDDPLQIPAILAYSPYQNIRPGVRYPRTLILTSTQDNQVGPSHARKFAAKLKEVGAAPMLLEGPTGGHSFPNAFTNPREFAMQITFFIEALMKPPASD
jgi:prolyl oligopeptidase